MKYWLVISNNKFFRLDDYLEERTSVTWRQTNNFEVGDKVFIYTTAPKFCISYEMDVVAVELTAEHFTDEEAYWTNPHDYITAIMANRFCEFSLVRRFHPDSMPLRLLKMHGLMTPRGNMLLEGDLLDFVLSTIEKGIINEEETEKDVYTTDLPEDGIYSEGVAIQVLANKYERNQKARKECIAKKGCKCLVCGLDFEETYGEKGRNFIHVHHVVPISSIGKEYQLNVETDLVPVCPNCHYMLHRKDPPYTILELREYLIEQNLGAPLMAAEPDEEYNKSVDLIVGVVKPESVEKFKKNEANMYYFGRKFPSKYNLKQIRFFAPYYEGGIRGYYDVKAVRTARKSEIVETHEENAANDIRIVLDLGEYHKMLESPKKVHLASYSYAFLSLKDTF